MRTEVVDFVCLRGRDAEYLISDMIYDRSYVATNDKFGKGRGGMTGGRLGDDWGMTGGDGWGDDWGMTGGGERNKGW